MSKIFTITEGLENLGALRTGGQGSVYKARRIGPVITAVKLIPTPIHTESEDDRNFRNFRNEVEKLKKVNEEPNPNVVKILNSGITESGSFPFIEMEYIEGPDLEELLKPPHAPIFTIKEAIRVAEQLACALNHCHKVGVRHGDVKSNNVKFNINSGNYVLLDFGLAVMSDEQRRSSLRHAGAVEFMAPEQNEGRMLFQTDVYSFGIVLFEILAGQVPFPLTDGGENARNNLRLQHMEAPVPNLLALRKQNMPSSWPQDQKEREMRVPEWLLDVIYRCLQKKPEDRYADGMALLDAISRQSVTGGTKAELQAENERLQSKVAKVSQKEEDDDSSVVRVSKPLFVVMIILLLLFMGLSCYYAFFDKATREKVLTQTPTDTSTIKTDTGSQNNQGLNSQATPSTQPAAPVTQDTAGVSPEPPVRREKPAETVPDSSMRPQADSTNEPSGNQEP
jgi:serine/threonine-protein kinase